MTHRVSDRSIHEDRAEVAFKLRKLVQSLNQETHRGALVVVEGKKDTVALRSFGFTGDCYEISQDGFPRFLKEAERRKKVVLLLDYDRKGRYLFAKALRLLQGKGISADSRYRNALREATNGEVRQIEEIKVYTGF